VVGLQAAEAVLGGLADLAGGQVLVVGAAAHRLVDLGRQDDLVAVAVALGQPAADDLLGGAVALLHVGALRPAVDVGGVDEVDAGVQGGVEDLVRGGLVGDVAEVHGPEREPADPEPGAPEVRVLHGGSLRWC